jgi:hypothetical protein
MPKTQHNPHLSRELAMLLARPQADGTPRSQRWLAEVSGLNISTLNMIIAGTRECSRDHLRALCTALPAPQEQLGVVVATLQDELLASGADPTRVLIRPVDGVDLQNLHLSPALNVDLGIIARRLATELGSGDRLATEHVEWLADMIARIEAHEADAAAAGRLRLLPPYQEKQHAVAETAAPAPEAPPMAVKHLARAAEQALGPALRPKPDSPPSPAPRK